MKKEDRKPTVPEKLSHLKVKEQKDRAAGLPAILSSGKHLFKEMGPQRALKALGKLNQVQGVDCPGCAWPDPEDERTPYAEYCENGVKAIAEEATKKRLLPAFFEKHSVTELAGWTDYELGKKGRIAQPMYLALDDKNYAEISWEEAFKRIAYHLNELNSPDEAIFYTSGRTSNEAAFLYQLFVREFGTNNLPDCSNMCHESSGVALTESLGIGKGSVTLSDFSEAEVILILGQNPGTNHPRMLTALEKAKKNGAKIIAVNPIKEAGLLHFSNPQRVEGLLGGKTRLSDCYLQPRINGDMALLQALIKLLLQREEEAPGSTFDQQFIKEKTSGVEEYLNHIRKQDFQELVKASGVKPETLQEAASYLAQSQKIIACWAMGLTQHKNAVDTIREIVNLLLLKGSIGKKGAGTCPVRGHSNVQGDRTMGIYEKPSRAFLNKIEETFAFRPPYKPGLNTVDSIEAMHSGKANIFFAMGGNFLSASPDTEYTAEALRSCTLTVHVSTKLNRSHLVHGKEALILPCLARTDLDLKNGLPQFVSVENSMGVVHSSQGNLKPVSDKLLSEPEIICRLAKAVNPESPVSWDEYWKDYDRVRDLIERCIPGFESYNQRVRKPGGFYLPNNARENKYSTASGLATFNISSICPIELQDDELLMMTIRSHDQFNTTIYGLNDRYRGIYNERRVILMNAKDIGRFGHTEGDLVDLSNEEDSRTRIARKFIVVPYDIPEGCAATYFPEANVLVPIKSTADHSHTPTSKSVVIKLRKHRNSVKP